MMSFFLFYRLSFNVTEDIDIISKVISSFVTIWTMDDSGLSLNILIILFTIQNIKNINFFDLDNPRLLILFKTTLSWFYVKCQRTQRMHKFFLEISRM